ncbi:hypothetical protein GYMLUDRAFT_172439 [Collybiopsis luxurians FD-317 M1]|uniref:Uncharacterized protein n=1 Tax=Collybiopsis luxurians FD-317 M1 TaxID=944289 RepID=A0A0D0CHC0_9AGAR|nr:hypothetical protein GYMLUDRAFT_172439 [Collybiopsis luxurians FD-317 M1]
MTTSPRILDVHTPFASFAISHSITQDSLQSLYDKLTRKVHNSYHGERVGPGWLKYEFNNSIWDLDDESDHTIFVWRQQQQTSPPDHELALSSSYSSAASATSTAVPPRNPVLHLHDPNQPLPVPPEYQNISYYVFQPSRQQALESSTRSNRSVKSKSTMRKKGTSIKDEGQTLDDVDAEPNFKQAFNKFHSENGVRTVMGSIGPVKNVRMLLKAGYRHVYISRKFALDHGFIPADAAPGHYGYSGLVNIGNWPITLTPSTVPSSLPEAPTAPSLHRSQSQSQSQHDGDAGIRLGPGNASTFSKKSGKRSKDAKAGGPKPTMMTVYLSEEPHFDVVLGRSFFERRQIRLTSVDPTDVVCLDTGEKIECELVILKDGRGEIVTVT